MPSEDLPKWVILEAKPKDDYTIFVKFADGKSGIFDAGDLIKRQPWNQVVDSGLFMQVRPAFGTLVWNDDVDIAPEYVYDKIT